MCYDILVLVALLGMYHHYSNLCYLSVFSLLENPIYLQVFSG